MIYCSVFIIKGALTAPVNCSDHIAEVVHAEIKARSFSPEALIELFLVFLSIIRGISDALSIFFLSVASPHAVEGLLASQEVIRLFLKHCGVAHINSYCKRD